MEIVEEANWPSVSVLVAARNEENNLKICLEALAAQMYSGEWEIWIGDDHSEDGTLAIVSDFCLGRTQFNFIQVPEAQTHVKGKALALGIMAEKAKGEILLVCDADMEMPKDWMKSMVAEMRKQKVDLINGSTTTRGENVFSILQGIDWLLPQGTFAWMSHLGISYTAMGNNMGISKKAYDSTGGYLKLPFSLTEDFELFKHSKENGYRLIHFYDSAVLGFSESEKSYSDWVNQHVRWMVGFIQLPFAQQLVFYIQLVFYPLFFLSIFLPNSSITIAIQALFFLKYLYECMLLIKLRRWQFLPFLPIYQLVWWPFYMLCLIRFHTSRSIIWKNRTWKK